MHARFGLWIVALLLLILSAWAPFRDARFGGEERDVSRDLLSGPAPVLLVDRSFRDGWKVRVSSGNEYWSVGKSGGRVELLTPEGRSASVFDTTPIRATAFVEHEADRPLLKISTDGVHGTGYRSAAVTWLCFDAGKIEDVLTVRESELEHDQKADGSTLVISSDTLILDAHNLWRDRWPEIRTRTFEERMILPPSENGDWTPRQRVPRTVRVTETRFEYDRLRRKYRKVAERTIEQA